MVSLQNVVKIMNKKGGLPVAFLVGLMITLVSFALILGTILRFYGQEDCTNLEKTCKETLAISAATSKSIGGVELFSFPKVCKTCDVHLKEEKEKVLGEIGNRIDRCWWMFQEGKVSEILGKDVFPGKNRCFICSTFSYSEGESISKPELLTYLKERQSLQVKGNTLDYIQKRGYLDITEDSISTQNSYALVYASNVDANWWSLQEFAGLVPSYDKNGLWLTHLSKVQNKCFIQQDIAGK
jgi:hypothetical protein